MKLISWNVNGIRALYKKGFIEFIEREDPDVLCVQETKAHIEQCEPPIRTAAGRVSHWSSAQKKGYSGVATFSRQAPATVLTTIGHEEYEAEGRIVITEQGDFKLYNIYFPNGGSRKERHDFKQKFLADLAAHLKPLVDRGDKIVVTGDYNIAHSEIDIHDPVKLAGESGFLPEERAWFDHFIKMGFVDTFRLLHPKETGRYTWWSYLERGRQIGNRGWRIDYFCVTKNLASRVVRAEVMDQTMGSDHCPVLLELADA
jgi:exodeoxyribonuclease-3